METSPNWFITNRAIGLYLWVFAFIFYLIAQSTQNFFGDYNYMTVVDGIISGALIISGSYLMKK